MGKYWKRRYYQNRRELQKQRKRMKILLTLTVLVIVIFGSLLLVGYAGQQIQDTASDAVDSITLLIFGWISANQSIVFTILFFGFFALIFLSWVWPKSSPPPSMGGY